MDKKQNKAFINIGTSAETAEFICDSLKNWWLNYGKSEYPSAIEHKVFPHITRAMAGIPLNTVESAKNSIESAKTKTGLTVVADVIKKTYEKGKVVSKDYMEYIKIKFGDSLSKLNYTISPINSS